MDQYILLNPIERRPSLPDTNKTSEEFEIKDNKRTRRQKYSPRLEYQNTPEMSEKNELIKSAGLYRNHDSPENKRLPNRQFYNNKSIPVKKTKKKSDEPLVWVLDTNK